MIKVSVFYPYAAGCRFDMATDSFQQSFGAHAAEIVADVPNYTNVRPAVQISEVKLQEGITDSSRRAAE